MSQAGQFRQYAEESKTLGRRFRSPRKSAPASPKASEYHLIDLTTGLSHGGFESLTGARQHAREKSLWPGTSSMGMFELSITIRVRSTLFALVKKPHRVSSGDVALRCHRAYVPSYQPQEAFCEEKSQSLV
jgi:hypothetical protein